MDLIEIIAMLTGHAMPTEMKNNLGRNGEDAIFCLFNDRQVTVYHTRLVEDIRNAPKITLRSHHDGNFVPSRKQLPRQIRTEMPRGTCNKTSHRSTEELVHRIGHILNGFTRQPGINAEPENLVHDKVGIVQIANAAMGNL